MANSGFFIKLNDEDNNKLNTLAALTGKSKAAVLKSALYQTGMNDYALIVYRHLLDMNNMLDVKDIEGAKGVMKELCTLLNSLLNQTKVK